MKVCAVEGCGRTATSRGWCRMHYKRWKRNGHPEKLVLQMNKPGQKCAVSWCETESKKRGLCETHYARHRANPGLPIEEIEPRQDQEKWVREHSDYVGDKCLIWPFGRSSNGYGTCAYHGTRTTASRAMCVEAHGFPPTEKHQAAHRCGNGHMGCVNPRHLYWADNATNQMDRVAHGTSNRGAAHGMSKLTPVDVLGIRLMVSGQPQRYVAREFGVSQGNVWRIASGKSWAHL